MSIRPISNALQEKAKRELNEVPERIEEDLNHIKEWIAKQPHLTVRMDDQWLLSFLRCCKHSLQRTKEKLDSYYSIRTLLTEYFSNRDIALPVMQHMLKSGYICPLENSANGTIIICRWHGIDPNMVQLNDIITLYFMTSDILLDANDNSIISGITLLVDHSELPITYLMQFTPPLLSKFFKCLTSGYPFRIKKICFINTPKGFETVFNICKSLVSEKISKRLHIFSKSNYNQLFEHIPESALPTEYGGKQESVNKLLEKWQEKVESYREWFLNDSKYGSNESLRIGQPKTSADLFGIEGSFKKLTVD